MVVIMICYHNFFFCGCDSGNIFFFFGGCDRGNGCENNVNSGNHIGKESGGAMDKLQRQWYSVVSGSSSVVECRLAVDGSVVKYEE